MYLKPQKLLIGSHGDILDIAVIASSSSENNNTFSVALVTNSPQLRIMNESFSCRILEGHSDIILCVDSSPDG